MSSTVVAHCGRCRQEKELVGNLRVSCAECIANPPVIRPAQSASERRRELAAKRRLALETLRIEELSLANKAVLGFFESRDNARFFALRAGDVFHPSPTCPRLAICEPEEIEYIPNRHLAAADKWRRDCLVCGAGVGGR